MATELAQRGNFVKWPGRAAWQEAGFVFACTLGNFLCVTPTVTAVFGIFLVPVSQQFGWRRAQVAAALGILTLANAIIFPLAGRIADRIGTRPVVLAGNIMLGLSIISLSVVPPNFIEFYGAYMLVGIAGAFSSGMLISKIISENFTARRGLWMGFAAGVGNGTGSTLMPILAGFLLERAGWRGAYLAIGSIVIIVGFPLLFLFLRHLPTRAAALARPQHAKPELARPQHAKPETASFGPELSLQAAAKTACFWMILGAIAISGGCMIAVFAHIVPIMTDKGFSLSKATMILSVFALTCAVWQSSVGWILDHTKSPRATAPLYLVAGLGLALLQYSYSLPGLVAAAAMLGIALGTEFGMLGYLISRYFGVHSFGAISGTMFAVVLGAQAVAPYLMDVVFDHTKSYNLALWVIEAAMVAAAFVITLLKPYPSALSAR